MNYKLGTCCVNPAQEALEGRPSLQDTPIKRAASMEPAGTPSSATSVGPPGHHFTG